MEKDDRLSWSAKPSEEFSVRSIYDWWMARQGVRSSILKIVWENQAPPKVKNFVWLVVLGRVKSSELLLKSGFIRDENEALCVFCGSAIESLDHLLL